MRGRVLLANSDRWFFVQLYRWFPSILKVLTIIRPETLIHWHQFWLSLLLALEVTIFGRPAADRDGAACVDPADEHGEPAFAERRRIHGELLKLRLRSLNRALPSTWSNGEDRPARDGSLSCAITP
jgi:hypothetical protein